MKQKLPYLLVLCAMVLYGCFGKSQADVQPIPDGTYSGEFRLLHIHPDNTSIIDTVKANISVYFAPVSTGTYMVTGDTSTVHAGSKGTFKADGPNHTIIFDDKTYSKTAPVTKTHLVGAYAYKYDGSSALQMVAFGALDTLVLQYDLKKTGN
ncbi:MAG TPA: hypothetical protein VHA56_21780 [Mucilaginibacter sp.]|nr:hypothetical protein [Mucilaginibacter sp.]